MPSASAMVGATPHEGLLKRAVTLSVFRKFGCRVWNHSPGRPYAHRQKLSHRGVPSRFLGFERPFGSNIVRVLLDDGRVTQSQTVVFADLPVVLPPVLLPAPEADMGAVGGGGSIESDSDDDDSAPTAHVPPPAALEEAPPAPQPAPRPAPTPDPAVAAAPHALVQPVAEQHPAPPTGRPVRSTRNPNPVYDRPIRRLQAQLAEVQAVAPERRLQVAADRNVARGEVRRVTFASPLVTAKHSVPGSGEPHSEGPRSGEPGVGELPNVEPSRRQRQRLYRVRRLRASRRRRKARHAAAHAACTMQQTPAPLVPQAPVAAALADAHAGSFAATPAFAGSAWYQALAKGAESPERLSVRADMQALAQACAAATAPVLPTPRSVAQAKRSEEWPQWELAICAELQSFFDHGVWEQGGCALPAGKTALPSHIVLDRKRDGRYKARLVAGGSHQQLWISTRPLHLCVHTAHCA